MAERLGWALYWIACGLAVLIALGGTGFLFFGTEPILRAIGAIIVVVAALVWGLGRLIRYVLAGE